MKITTEKVIKASVEDVFRVFTDFHGLKDRVTGIVDLEFLEGSGEPKVGMKWRETRVMFGKEATEEMWISSITENASYVVEAESHGMHYTSKYTFTPVDGGTQVVLTFEGTPLTFGTKVFGPIFGVLFKGVTQKAFDADITELKNVLEEA